MICPRLISVRATRTDLAGAGSAIGDASAISAARCAASQARASMAEPPAKPTARKSNSKVRKHIVSIEVRWKDDDQAGDVDGNDQGARFHRFIGGQKSDIQPETPAPAP